MSLSEKINKLKALFGQKNTFTNSDQYWKQRYEKGGNSGAGSYDHLAEFKAEVLNDFVKENNIQMVIEFGSGDGNQLRYFHFPQYLGFDISPKAIELCRNAYKNDATKEFKLTSEFTIQKADLTLSLDVVYHLIEDEIFHRYMTDLFKASDRFVIIYSSNSEELNTATAPHVKHRVFTNWVEKNQPDFKLVKTIKNKYPYKPETQDGSFADFYIFGK